MSPTIGDIFFTFLRITVLAFGSAIPWVHGTIVTRKRWLSETEFAETLSLCSFFTGANITNLTVVVGMRFRGLAGGLAALAGLVIAPVAILIVVVALYEHIKDVPAIRGALRGLSAAAVGLFLVMVYRLVAVILRARPAVMLPIAALACAGILSNILSIPLALLTFGPASIAVAWFHKR